jgi:peptidyl-prolyl cis-trans isomerase D
LSGENRIQEQGMAKGKKNTAHLTKKQLSRHQREQRQLRWIWISLVTITALVVVVLAAGLIFPSTQSVAMVNGESIRVGDYQKRVRFWYHYYNDYLMPGSFDNLEADQKTEFYQEIANQLIEEKLVRQEAQKNLLSITEDEIQIRIEEDWFQHYRDPLTPTPSPTPDPEATPTPASTPLPTSTPDTEEAFQTKYKEFVDSVLKPSRMSENDFREMVGATLLREKLEPVLVPTVPQEEEQVRFRYTVAQDAEEAQAKIAAFEAGVEEQVHARHILVGTMEEAESILTKLQDGQDFAALAAEYSTDESNKNDGGDLGWFGRGRMVQEFETAAFEGEIGLYPVPVETQFGFHVIEILGHEDRPIDRSEEMFEPGWYGKSELADQFGALFAEIVFSSEIGLLPDPVPTDFGVAVVEVLERQVRSLDEAAQNDRRTQLFEDRLAEIKTEADIQNKWDASMVPAKM